MDHEKWYESGSDRLVNPIWQWFKDRTFRKIWKNAGILLSGDLMNAAFSLVSVALTARALGPEHFGVLILIQSYVRVADVVFNFQSWQAIIKYGTDCIERRRPEDFKRLIKFGTLLDSGSALLGAAIAALGVYWFAQRQQWSTDIALMATLYSLTIAVNVVGTPTAILRLYDKFKWIAMQRTIVAGIKMIAVIIVFKFTKGALWTFLLIWMVMRVIEFLSIVALGWYELFNQGFHRTLASKARGVANKFPGLWKFVISTNLSSSVRLGVKEVDVLIVGGIIGPAMAGIYQIAKQFCNIANRFTDPFQQAIYPDLAKLWTNGMWKKFKKFVIRIGILSGLGGLVTWLFFVVAGDFIIQIVVGEKYIAAYGVMVVYMLGNIICFFGVAFGPAVLSMGHAERILLIHIVGHVLYFPILVGLLWQIGVMGAAIAQVVFHGFWFVGMSFSIAHFGRTGNRVPIAGEPVS